MKRVVVVLAFMMIISCSISKKQSVEIACGQCLFGLSTQKGCDLAIKVKDEAYFVDGANIDDFGDAHDKNTGFCEVIRRAEVSGFLFENRFQIQSINLNN